MKPPKDLNCRLVHFGLFLSQYTAGYIAFNNLGRKGIKVLDYSL